MMLAAKTALAVRYDALGEDISTEMGINNRAKLEKRIRFFEEGGLTRISGTGKSKSAQKKYEVKTENITSYNTAADSTIGKKRKLEEEEEEEEEKAEEAPAEEAPAADEDSETPKKKKKKKKKSIAAEEEYIDDFSQELYWK